MLHRPRCRGEHQAEQRAKDGKQDNRRRPPPSRSVVDTDYLKCPHESDRRLRFRKDASVERLSARGIELSDRRGELYAIGRCGQGGQ